MAGGYLGKISAVIAANTGDYVRGLNESAKATKEFASSVQNTLKRSASEAAKAFEGIYTPLQQFERAIRQAGALRLNFKGFENAVRNINDLQKRLQGVLTEKEVELVVKTSGLKDIEAVKAAINNLSKQEITLATVAGGRAGLLRERERMRGDGAETTTIANIKATAAEVDALIEKLGVLDDRKIDVIIDILNERGLEEAVTKARRLQEAANDIARPFARATQSFSELAGNIQAAFIPAFGRIQGAVDRLGKDLDSSAAVSADRFESVRQGALRAAEAVQRLAEAQELANSGATGRELGFVSPRVADELRRSAELANQAADTPSERLAADGQIAKDVQQLKNLRSLIAQYNAEVESARFLNLDTGAAQKRLDAALLTSQRLRTSLSERLRLIFDTSGADEAAAAIERSKVAANEAAKSLTGLFAATNSAFSGLPQTVDEAEQAFRSLLATISALGDEQRGALKPIGDEILELITAARNGADNLGELNAAVQRLRGATAGQSFTVRRGDPGGAFGPTLPPEIEAQRRLERDRARAASAFLPPVLQSRSAAISDPAGFRRQTFGPEVGNATRQLESLKSGIAGVKTQIDQLPAGIQSQFIPAIQRAEQEFVRLAASPRAANSELARLKARLDEVQSSAKRAAEAQQFAKNFGGGGAAGLDIGIDQRSLRAVGAEIEFIQGKLAGLSKDARGPAVAALERLRQVASRAFSDGTWSTKEAQAEINNARNEVVRLTAALAGVSPRRLADQLKRIGDVARGSFGNAGLAIQQAAFAFEDFFSVTGGLDQRIRAAGNNISQLGFILGGPLGLGVGIAVGLIAQLAAVTIKWSGSTEEAERRQNALKLALEATNAALERQRQLVEQIRDAYKELTKSIRDAGLTERQRAELERQKPLDELNRLREQQRRAAAEATDAGIARINAQIAQIDELLKTEQDLFKRLQLLLDRQVAVGQRDKAIAGIERRGEQVAAGALSGRTPDEAADALRAREAELRRKLLQIEFEGLQGDRKAAGEAAERVLREIAVIENALQRVAARSQDIGLDRQRRTADAVARANANVADIEGIRLFERVAGELLKRQQEAATQFQAGEISFAQFTAVLEQAAGLAQPIQNAAVAVREFSDALNSAAGELARTVEQELLSRANQLRRDANAAEAQFGAADPRTQSARRSQEEIEAARRRATEQRLQLASEESQARIRFEESVLAGTGGNERARNLINEIRKIDEFLAMPSTSDEMTKQQEQARVDRQTFQNRLEEIFSALPEIQGIRRRADEVDIQAQQEIQRVLNRTESEARGRELLKTPAQRAAEEFDQQIRDIRAATEAQVQGIFDAAGGLPSDEDRQRARDAFGAEREALSRQFIEQARQVAPAIMGFRDERLNAALQGPSRQALNVADVQTMDGQRELNRLLRGDDSAKDVNLQELREQTRLLDELLKTAQQQGVTVELSG